MGLSGQFRAACTCAPRPRRGRLYPMNGPSPLRAPAHPTPSSDHDVDAVVGRAARRDRDANRRRDRTARATRGGSACAVARERVEPRRVESRARHRAVASDDAIGDQDGSATRACAL